MAGDGDPRRWRALVVCVVALSVTLPDVSIVMVGLHSIGRDTGAGPAQLQWVISGYALAGSKEPSRSRGTSISTGPTSDSPARGVA